MNRGKHVLRLRRAGFRLVRQGSKSDAWAFGDVMVIVGHGSHGKNQFDCEIRTALRRVSGRGKP
jgi:hypothetical protein